MNKRKIAIILSLVLVIGLVGCKNNKNSATNNASNPELSKNISEAEAKEIALNQFDLHEDDAEFISIKKDFDDGVEKYELEFISEDEKFEVDINIEDGSILKYERESIGLNNPKHRDGIISEEEAKQIVLEKVPGASDSDFTKFKRDVDNARIKYEGKLLYEAVEYEFEIDAETGELLDWEEDKL